MKLISRKEDCCPNYGGFFFKQIQLFLPLVCQEYIPRASGDACNCGLYQYPYILCFFLYIYTYEV